MEGTDESLMTSHRELTPGEGKSQAQILLQTPLWLPADLAPLNTEKLETARLQPAYRELKLTYELLQQDFTARR